MLGYVLFSSQLLPAQRRGIVLLVGCSPTRSAKVRLTLVWQRAFFANLLVNRGRTVVDDTSITCFIPDVLRCDWHLLLEVNYATVDLATHSRPRASFYERRPAWSTATTRWRRHPESERWYDRVAIRHRRLSVLHPRGRGGRTTDRIMRRHFLGLR